MKYIKDLREGDRISDIYLCKTKNPGGHEKRKTV